MSDFGGQSAGGTPSAPPGWYPVDGSQQRYWDGAQWTEHTAPLAPQPGPAAPPPGSDLGAGGPTPGWPAGPASSGFEPMPFGAPAPAYAGAVSSDDRSMAMLAHILALFSGFIGPLIIWLVKKDQSAFVDHHGKEALNFQITMILAWIVSLLSLIVLIGLLLLPIVAILAFVLPIVAAVSANRGDYYRYPLTIRFIS